jgi:hypothetical protein
MTTNQRFSLTEDRHVIDRLNPRNNRKAWCHEGDREDDIRLRERLLWNRLADLVESLIVNRNPVAMLPNGETYQPFFEERHSISWALYNAIKASHLNTLDVALSLQHKFDGRLRREKKGMQDYTSLSLFVDDVECLLRDLYGECDQQAKDRVRQAVLTIVEEFTKYVCKDLWEEHQSAKDIDYVFGIGLPDGYGMSGSDHRRMNRAVRDLTERARIVRADPTMFSKYTVSFVNDLYENWRPLSRPREEAENGSNVTDVPF